MTNKQQLNLLSSLAVLQAELQTSRRQLKVELDGHPSDESLVLSSTAPGANGNAREPQSSKTTKARLGASYRVTVFDTLKLENEYVIISLKVGAWDALPDSQLEALPNGVETDRVKMEATEEDPAAAASRLWSEARPIAIHLIPSIPSEHMRDLQATCLLVCSPRIKLLQMPDKALSALIQIVQTSLQSFANHLLKPRTVFQIV